MRLPNLIKVALKAMLKNKMRSLLTMLGIIIGVGSVIVMVAIGQGTQKQISSQIGSLGVNLLMVFPNNFRQGGVSQGRTSRLTLKDVEKLKKEGTLLAGVSPMITISLQAVAGANNWTTTAYGVSPDFKDIRQWTVNEGDFFTDYDVKAQTKVCVIGFTISTNLFPDGNALGQQIRLRNVPFRIIGILASKGSSSFGNDQDDLVLAPYTTVQNRLNRNRFFGQILCSSISSDKMDDAQEQIRQIMRSSHKLTESASDDFSIGNQADIISTAKQTTGFLTTLLASIAGISLIVGGIGIMNIMLVSVTERTREIGIRMAIGAKERDILMQFLLESIALSVTGGSIGIVMGFVAMLIVGMITGWAMALSLPTVLLAFTFSALVGIFFGFYPARKAAGMNPIDALRYE